MKLPLLLALALLFARAAAAETVPVQLSPGVPTLAPAPDSTLALPDPNAPPIAEPSVAPDAAPAPAAKLAKFEPASGCYIGAFMERDFSVMGDIGVWEEFTGKKHASYITYVGYGRPFPSEWVEKLKRSGAAPHIAFEPNDGLAKVEDGPYLRAWARDAARSKTPIFLRWASEMNGDWMWKHYFKGSPSAVKNGDPAGYIEKFRLVARVMKEEAPNVAMVWTPFASRQRLIASYYPGDDWVDWVGVNIYAVFVNDGDPFRPAAQRDHIAELRWIYERYADRKPIHISEFAATIFCKGTSEDTVAFAIARMNEFYGAIRREFPRVKSINWFSLDTIRAGLRNNNYSFIDDGRALATYRRLVSDPYFLSETQDDTSLYKTQVPEGTTLGPNGHTIPLSATPEELLAASGALQVGAGSQGRVLGDNGSIHTAPRNVPLADDARLGTPTIGGVKAGDIARGVLDLSVTLPVGLDAKKIERVEWLLDGRVAWMTNMAPLGWSLRARRLNPGTHEVQVRLWLKGREESLTSQAVAFEVTD